MKRMPLTQKSTFPSLEKIDTSNLEIKGHQRFNFHKVSKQLLPTSILEDDFYFTGDFNGKSFKSFKNFNGF